MPVKSAGESAADVDFRFAEKCGGEDDGTSLTFKEKENIKSPAEAALLSGRAGVVAKYSAVKVHCDWNAGNEEESIL